MNDAPESISSDPADYESTSWVIRDQLQTGNHKAYSCKLTGSVALHERCLRKVCSALNFQLEVFRVDAVNTTRRHVAILVHRRTTEGRLTGVDLRCSTFACGQSSIACGFEDHLCFAIQSQASENVRDFIVTIGRLIVDVAQNTQTVIDVAGLVVPVRS